MDSGDIIRMAREVHDGVVFMPEDLERFANLVAAHEREACAKIAQDFAKKWWGIHCATNRHLNTTRAAHDDFCKVDNAIRARGKA